MEPIFDRDGAAVAWRRRDVVYDHAGDARAFVANRSLYALDGRWLARVEDGLYRDRRGRTVAFERDATGGPLLPLPQPPPVAPMPALRPPQPVFAPAPPPAMRSLAWSDVAWEALLEASEMPVLGSSV